MYIVQKAEERKTVQDGLGNDETTVTRSIGDQAHSVTTVTDKDGTQNVKEHYSNMDESKYGHGHKYCRYMDTILFRKRSLDGLSARS